MEGVLCLVRLLMLRGTRGLRWAQLHRHSSCHSYSSPQRVGNYTLSYGMMGISSSSSSRATGFRKVIDLSETKAEGSDMSNAGVTGPDQSAQPLISILTYNILANMYLELIFLILIITFSHDINQDMRTCPPIPNAPCPSCNGIIENNG